MSENELEAMEQIAMAASVEPITLLRHGCG